MQRWSSSLSQSHWSFTLLFSQNPFVGPLCRGARICWGPIVLCGKITAHCLLPLLAFHTHFRQSTISCTPKILLHSQSANYNMSTEFMHSIYTWIINCKFHIITIFIAMLSPTSPHSSTPSAAILHRYQLNEIFPISEIPRKFWFRWKCIY